MELYFAGGSIFFKPYEVDIGLNHNRLLSYDYQKRFVDKTINSRKGKNLKEYPTAVGSFLFDTNSNNKLFIDSGAFSAWTKGSVIDCDKYIEWINERSQDIDLCGQVDVIPGDRVFGATPQQVREAAKKTWENYLYMRSKLKNPDALLYTYHIGEPIEFLRQALEYRDENGERIKYMALGGMVGKPHKIRDTFLEKCFITIRESSNPNIKIHAFGMTDFDLLEKYPIYSADSTSYIMVGGMGNIMTDYGNIAVSNNQKHDKNHYSHLPKDAIDNFNKLIQEFGFTLHQLSEDYNNRILFNAMYMNKKSTGT